jgi:xylose isomerase
MFKALNDLGWKGVIEFDCHMLRAEGDFNHAAESRMQFIRNSVEAVAIAVELAGRIGTPDMSKGQSAADLAAIRRMCRL